MSIQLYPSIAKIKRNGVYENLPGFVPETGSIATQQMIATSESSATAQYVHNKGEYFRLNDTLYQAIVKINVGDSIVVGTNCEVAVLGNDLTHVANSIAAYELGIASSSHNTGDYFMVGETLYVATSDIQVGDTISTSTNCRLAVVGDELSGLKNAVDAQSEQIKQDYANIVPIEQGYWTIADGSAGDSSTWCRTAGFITKDSIIRTTTLRMFLMAYNKITGAYEGTWNGSEFNTTYASSLVVQEYNINEFTKNYPNYMFKISFKKASGNLSPTEVYADMTVIKLIDNLSDDELYIGKTDIFNFKEDNGYALNYSTPLKYSSFKLKIDKVNGNHTTFSIRAKYGTGSATVLKSGCAFGTEYDIETDLSQYNTLVIYQSAPSSHPTAYGSTSYNLTVIGNNTLNGRLYKIEANPTALAGKKILMLGDSITQLPITGNYTDKGIVEYVSEMTGATCIRGAIGGSKMQGGDPLPELPITNINDAKTALNVVYIAKALADGDLSVQQAAAQYVYDNGGDTAWKSIIDNLAELDMTKIDAVTLFAGTNDFRSSLYLGDENDDTDFTYCGAINNIVNALCTAYPKLTIFVFTPIVRHFVDSKTESTAADFSDTYTNSRGDKLTDYVEKAKATALRNHVPCLDLYNGMGWNVYNFWQYFPSNDGCHPRNSFNMLARLIADFMIAQWNR